MIGKYTATSFVNDPLVLLFRWATSGPREQKRHWMFRHWTDHTILLTITWRFGDSQIGTIDRQISRHELEDAYDSSEIVLSAVEAMLEQFEKGNY